MMGFLGRPDCTIKSVHEGGFLYGIPASWVNQWWVDHYNGDFIGVAIDPEDPPFYEGVAVFLERNGLLSKVEKDWLAEHPEALKLERLSPSNWV